MQRHANTHDQLRRNVATSYKWRRYEMLQHVRRLSMILVMFPQVTHCLKHATRTVTK